MEILSPRDADREDGDWVIWRSHLAPEIGNVKTHVHRINQVTWGLPWRARQYWLHWAEQTPSVLPPYLGARAAGHRRVPQGSHVHSASCPGLTCIGCDQTMRKCLEQWAELWEHVISGGGAWLGEPAGLAELSNGSETEVPGSGAAGQHTLASENYSSLGITWHSQSTVLWVQGSFDFFKIRDMLFLLSLLLRQGQSRRTRKIIIQVPFIWCQWILLWPQRFLLCLASLIFLVREIVITASQRRHEVEEQ